MSLPALSWFGQCPVSGSESENSHVRWDPAVQEKLSVFFFLNGYRLGLG